MPEVPRVLTVALAERMGIGRGRVRTEIRRGNWQRLAPGVVLTRPDEPTRFDWAEAGVLLAGPDAAVTGWEALRAIGLGDRTPPAAPPVVLMTRGLGRQVGQVRLRRTSRRYVTRLLPADADRLALTPIVPPPRSIADAALQYRDATRVRALVTSAISRRVCRVEDLLAELEAMPRQHSALLRLGLALAHYPPSAIDRPGWTDEVAGWLRARARELGVPYVPGGGVRTAGVLTAGVLTFEP